MYTRSCCISHPLHVAAGCVCSPCLSTSSPTSYYIPWYAAWPQFQGVASYLACTWNVLGFGPMPGNQRIFSWIHKAIARHWAPQWSSMQFSSILFFRWFSTTAVQPLSLKPVSTAQIGESDKPTGTYLISTPLCHQVVWPCLVLCGCCKVCRAIEFSNVPCAVRRFNVQMRNCTTTLLIARSHAITRGHWNHLKSF